MGLRSLSWRWFVGALADVDEADPRLLRALIRKDRKFDRRASKSVRDRIAVRMLRKFSSLDRGKKPSIYADSGEIPLQRSPEEVLCQQLRKFRQAARLFGLKKDGINLLSHDLQKYIFRKEDATLKSSLDSLKTKILEGHSTALLALKRRGGLSSDKIQSDVNIEPKNGKKHKIDDLDVNVQPLERSSPSLAPDSDSEGFEEGSFEPIEQLSTMNVADSDRMIPYQADALTGLNHQDSDNGVEKEKQKMVELSTFGDHEIQTESVLVCRNDTEKSTNGSSDPVQHFHKTDVADANIVGLEANTVRELPQNNMCKLSGDAIIIDAAKGQLLRQTSAATTVGKSNKILQKKSSKLLKLSTQHNVDNVNKKSCLGGGSISTSDGRVQLNDNATSKPGGGSISTSDGHVQLNDNATSKPDELVHGNGTDITGSQDEHFHNREPSVSPEVPNEDDGSYGIPSRLHLVNEISSAYLSSIQVHVGDDSVIGGLAGVGLCMKCLKDGASLTCNGKGCMFAFHESCLEQLAKVKKSGLFYCPFCSYKRFAREVKRAWKAIRALTGMDVPQGLKKKRSSAHILQSNQARAAGSTNEGVNVDTDQSRECKSHEIHGMTEEQNQRIDTSHICDKRKCSSSQTVILMSEAECAVSHSRVEIDDGKMVNEVTLSMLQETDHASLNRENVLGNDDEQIEMTNQHFQVEPHKVSDNNSLPSNNIPSHVGEVHDVSNAKQERFLSRDNDQSTLHHMQSEQQNQAVCDDDSPKKESKAERHGKRKRQDTLIVNIPHPMVTLNNDRKTRTSSSNHKGRRYGVKRYSNPVAPLGRRKNLPWTKDEEKALVEAMDEYAQSNVKNVSWAKILELGCGKFHKTRLPGDLKDKWRNMKKKKEQIMDDNPDASDDPDHPDNQ